MPACVKTNPNTPQSGPTNALKRSADVMQCVLCFFVLGPAQISFPGRARLHRHRRAHLSKVWVSLRGSSNGMPSRAAHRTIAKATIPSGSSTDPCPHFIFLFGFLSHVHINAHTCYRTFLFFLLCFAFDIKKIGLCVTCNFRVRNFRSIVYEVTVNMIARTKSRYNAQSTS